MLTARSINSYVNSQRTSLLKHGDNAAEILPKVIKRQLSSTDPSC